MTKQEREKKVKKLKFDKNKVTQEQINALSDEVLAKLSEDGEIVSITTQESTINTQPKIPGVGRMNSAYRLPGTLATMPTSDFVMTVVAQAIKEKGTADNFQFVAEGDWKVNPDYEFVDTIALAWSDSFTLYYDVSEHYTYKSGKLYMFSGTRNSAKAEAGVGHDVDLKVGYTDDKSILLAKVYKANSKGSGNVVGEYGHVQLTAKLKIFL
jgi:hypothetical protein